MEETREIICIVGLGYVGLPLAVAFSKDFHVIGIDVDDKRIVALQHGIDTTNSVDGKILQEKIQENKITFTGDFSFAKKAQYIIVAVPTPVDDAKKPELSALKNATRFIGKNLSLGTIVIYESTVYPGVTEQICLPILEKESGLKLGQFGLGYSPERINPGDELHRLDNVVKIVSGHDKPTLDKVAALYEKIVLAGVYRAPNIKVAEAAKVVENVQRDLNIALMNELALIFHKLNIDTQEILKAAGTKWNFHQYYPGLVGGHCFDKNTILFLKNHEKQKIISIGDYIDSLDCRKHNIGYTEIFYPENVKILSYDIVKNKTSFKPVTAASRRKSNEILRIKTAYNYNLDITNRHPIIIFDNGNLKIKFAKDVVVGDKLVLNKNLPSTKRNIAINILKYLDRSIYKKIRVKIKDRTMWEFKEIIDKYLIGKKANYYTWNYLPLEEYLLLEKKLKISKENIYFCTGRGPGFKKFPSIFKIDNDILRLIGYYLSKGCITEDNAVRVRFTFHREEKEYIDDVASILRKAGIDYSIYNNKTYKSTVIKVSSYLFGFVLKDILKTGINCYTMQIPELFFDLNKKSKEEILKGLFRGDGGVKWCYKDRSYQKNGKRFVHKNNSIEVSYFTSSHILFQQVLLFLLNQNILPKLAKRKGYFSIAGHQDIKKIKNWFLGDKMKKIEQYFQNKQRLVTYKKAKKYKNYMTINVESIDKKRADYVYSMEVENTHTLITSYGLIAHNCIGVDPYYLAFQAIEHGYHPKIILSGREVNDYMARHIAELAFKELNYTGKILKQSTVLLLGLTFKEDVTDIRNSRAVDVVHYLQGFGICVVACEPHISNETVQESFGIQNLSINDLPDCDAIILINKHKQFSSLTLDYLKEKTGANIIIDIKCLFSRKEAEEKGFVYRTL